mmetsp:Transcript_13946/g.32925  ORF Transcript_13946/g.32925 Transcript_13946/m.32925 type:complete len:259 (+) Transcript_13946:1198-1974(+)
MQEHKSLDRCAPRRQRLLPRRDGALPARRHVHRPENPGEQLRGARRGRGRGGAVDLPRELCDHPQLPRAARDRGVCRRPPGDPQDARRQRRQGRHRARGQAARLPPHLPGEGGEGAPRALRARPLQRCHHQQRGEGRPGACDEQGEGAAVRHRGGDHHPPHRRPHPAQPPGGQRRVAAEHPPLLSLPRFPTPRAAARACARGDAPGPRGGGGGMGGPTLAGRVRQSPPPVLPPVPPLRISASSLSRGAFGSASSPPFL